MRLHPLLVTLVFASGLALAQPSPARAQDLIYVVTTTTDLRSLAEAVGGDFIDAVSLVPANFDAEEYQPKPQDVLRLKNARLVVRVGLDYDLWFDRLLQASDRSDINRGGPRYVDASFGIAPLEVRGVTVGPGDGHAHGSGNPHYWLDPKNAEFITANILEGLTRIDPANTKTYEANRQAFLARLFRLDFADFLEIKPGVPPSPSHLAGIIQTMRTRGVSVVVREPHEPERDLAFVADKTAASVAVLAASVGALPDTGDYLSLFETDVAALVSAAAAR